MRANKTDELLICNRLLISVNRILQASRSFYAKNMKCHNRGQNIDVVSYFNVQIPSVKIWLPHASFVYEDRGSCEVSVLVFCDSFARARFRGTGEWREEGGVFMSV